jgi:hypothetical protein
MLVIDHLRYSSHRVGQGASEVSSLTFSSFSHSVVTCEYNQVQIADVTIKIKIGVAISLTIISMEFGSECEEIAAIYITVEVVVALTQGRRTKGMTKIQQKARIMTGPGPNLAVLL